MENNKNIIKTESIINLLSTKNLGEIQDLLKNFRISKIKNNRNNQNNKSGEKKPISKDRISKTRNKKDI